MEEFFLIMFRLTIIIHLNIFYKPLNFLNIYLTLTIAVVTLSESPDKALLVQVTTLHFHSEEDTPSHGITGGRAGGYLGSYLDCIN